MAESEPMMMHGYLHGEQVSALIRTYMRLSEPAPAGFIQNVDDLTTCKQSTTIANTRSRKKMG
jgi:hypothetical protein